ncbi:hypothetical protein KP509_31G031100 [Ceratopteris richardii]|uniref:TFIIS N-terminal domain-containing protein n=1 Tax=Ceratopteris richardii TaxID=49495 RepID=A0A8T2QX18_CERRI|nr:hypothetical protein KP509_31G031100 [Ceratopteris richardii]
MTVHVIESVVATARRPCFRESAEDPREYCADTIATGTYEASHDRLIKLREELELLRAFGAENEDKQNREIKDSLLLIEEVMVDSCCEDVCKLLETTKIGRTVNQLTKHPPTCVRQISKKLVSSWKALYLANLKTTRSSSGEVVEAKQPNVTVHHHQQTPPGKTEKSFRDTQNCPRTAPEDKAFTLAPQPAEEDKKKMHIALDPRVRRQSSSSSTLSREDVGMKSEHHLQKRSLGSRGPERAVVGHEQKMAESKRKLCMGYAKERDL